MEKQQKDRGLVIGVIVFVFLIILSVVFFLLYQNTNNGADPNAFRFRRIYHRASNSYLRIRLIPTQEVTTIDTPDEAGYYPVLTIGGTEKDPLGLWNIIPNTKVIEGKTVWSLRNEYSLRYQSEPVIREDTFVIVINAENEPTTSNGSWFEITGFEGKTQRILNKELVPPTVFTIKPVGKSPIVSTHKKLYPSVLRSIINDTTTGGDVFELRVPAITPSS